MFGIIGSASAASKRFLQAKFLADGQALRVFVYLLFVEPNTAAIFKNVAKSSV
ncbi:MAG: hypothetical protein QM530_10430 [Phycisphaerales bacterium]|nr:hypothetical protein [Phycisphaerales bacterium]